jgi:hypothetical protein
MAVVNGVVFVCASGYGSIGTGIKNLPAPKRSLKYFTIASTVI